MIISVVYFQLIFLCGVTQIIYVCVILACPHYKRNSVTQIVITVFVWCWIHSAGRWQCRWPCLQFGVIRITGHCLRTKTHHFINELVVHPHGAKGCVCCYYLCIYIDSYNKILTEVPVYWKVADQSFVTLSPLFWIHSRCSAPFTVSESKRWKKCALWRMPTSLNLYFCDTRI